VSDKFIKLEKLYRALIDDYDRVVKRNGELVQQNDFLRVEITGVSNP
jgi:hypothetical protein